jgi:cytochrome c oxidase subunit II
MPNQRMSSPRPNRPGPKKGKPRSGRPFLRLRVVGFLVIALAVFGAAVVLVSPPRSTVAADAIPVRVDMAGFEPKTIEVKAGTPVKLQLINPDSAAHSDGGGKHQFAIPELGVDAIVQPRSEQIVTFTPAKPGTYTFYCDICCGGKENPTMRGSLTVAS